MYGRMGSPSAHGYHDPHPMGGFQSMHSYSTNQPYSSGFPYGSPMPIMMDRGGGGRGLVDGFPDNLGPPGAQSGGAGMGGFPQSDPWRRGRLWRTVCVLGVFSDTHVHVYMFRVS